jgi:hypothetical protein
LLSSAILKTTSPLTERTVAAVRRVTTSEHPFANPQQRASKKVSAGKRITNLFERAAAWTGVEPNGFTYEEFFPQSIRCLFLGLGTGSKRKPARTRVEADFNISQISAMSTEICASQGVNCIQPECGFCTIRAELRSSSVRICPKTFPARRRRRKYRQQGQSGNP